MLTRLWIALLAVAMAAAAATAMLLPRPIAADREREAGVRLERAQQAAALFLRVNARNWMDSAAHVAGDAVLMESLDQATRGPADLGLVHRTVQERLRTFRESTKVDLLIAADGHGRVIARAGMDEGVYKDGVEGFPLVADALRGLRGDDTWSLGGKLFRVVASPVVAHEHYAGAIMMAQEVGSALAQSMKQLFGVEVAFLLRGRVLASSSALPVVGQLPMVLQQATAAGVSLQSAEAEGERYLIAVSPFVGEAAGHQAAYVLLLARPPAPSLRGLVDELARSDFQTLPWHDLIPVGAAAAAAIIVGLLLFWLEARKPASRLADEAQALARGEVGRLDDRRHPGALGRVARAVNTTLDRVAARHQGREKPRPKFVPYEPEPTPSEPTPSAIRRITIDHAPVQRIIDAPSAPLPIVTELPPSQPQHAQPGAFEEESPATGRDYIEAPAALTTPLTQLAGAAAAGGEVARVPQNFDAEERTVATKMDIPAAIPDEDPLEAELQAVFQEFVETKQRLGESIEGVTYNKFAKKLRANRAELIARYGCQEVRFQVYIKDGKAALKATPVQA
jgi:hypothetical protein